MCSGATCGELFFRFQFAHTSDSLESGPADDGEVSEKRAINNLRMQWRAIPAQFAPQYVIGLLDVTLTFDALRALKGRHEFI